jgi:hypothetical protein
LENADAICPHVVIAEAKNQEASGLNHSGTSRIGALGLIRKMLSAIELDHQLCGMTHEVGDVVFDWYLAPEASAVQPVIAQLRPENSFSVGGFLSELARV